MHLWIDEQIEHNSEIIITKVSPKTRSQTNLQKMQEELQLKLQNSLAVATNHRGFITKQQNSPNKISRVKANRVISNPTTRHCASSTTDQQTIDLSFDTTSTSTSTSSSPNTAQAKAKRAYRRNTGTIRKIIEDKNEVVSSAINSTELTKFASVNDIFKTTVGSNLLFTTAPSNVYTPQSSSNESSRDSKF